MRASQFGNFRYQHPRIPSWYTSLSIVKSEFQGHKKLLMLILLMIGRRRLLTCAQNLRPIHSIKRQWPPTLWSLSSVWVRAEQSFLPISTPLKSSVSHRSQSETSTPLQVFDRGHIKFLVCIQCSTPSEASVNTKCLHKASCPIWHPVNPCKNRTYDRAFGSSFKLGERDADNYNSDTHIESH